MIRLYICIAMVIILAGLSVFTSVRLNTLINNNLEKAEAIAGSALEDGEHTAALCRSLQEDWVKDVNRMELYISHRQLDNLCEYISKLEVWAVTDEEDELLSGIAYIRSALQRIRDDELLSWQSLV